MSAWELLPETGLRSRLVRVTRETLEGRYGTVAHQSAAEAVVAALLQELQLDPPQVVHGVETR